ncbi:hypothetical protein COLO4_36639 [Corchorus olitorius]|uniref:Uncharacterized protein n=1 Tax=Corchorus olitorius TaxID=93759 RepID=A0A1R3G723_9ROSI|nr:hypothetical protein COLO4_36639 [Corchorus olitorius]
MENRGEGRTYLKIGPIQRQIWVGEVEASLLVESRLPSATGLNSDTVDYGGNSGGLILRRSKGRER